MDVATPSALLSPITSVASTLGTVLEKMLPAPPPPNRNSNSSDNPCGDISPVDKANADKPGVVEYETDIGDSGIIN